MHFRRPPIAVLTAFALAVVAHAQTSQTSGALRGTVKDRSGKVISGASIRATNLETGAGRTVMSTASGDYTFPLLPSGIYEVLVSAPGFKPVKETIRVTLGNSVTLSPALEASEVGAVVEVVAAAGTVDTRQVSTVTTLEQDLVQSIPLVTRNFTDVAKLAPGVTAGSGSPARLVVEGGRQIFNAIQIDGASNNSAFFNEQRGGVYTPFIFGADTIKELQVVTNGFDAQYAQAGATINAITKGGTNEVTGSALYQLRKTAWTESSDRPPYGGSGAAARTNDSENLNFNIGGPLIKDKLFYFVGVERYTKKITANPIATTTSTAAGMTAADRTTFLASPLGGVITSRSGLTLAQEFGDPGLGIPAHPYPMSNTNTVYFGRVDWVASQNHRFVFRVNFQDMTDTLQNTSASPNNAESNNIPTRVQSISWVLEANNIWTPELYTESRLQLAREARPMTGNAAPGTPAIAIPTSGTNMSFGTKTSTPRESNELTTQFFSATTWAHGDLQIKGGVDFLRVDEDNQFFQNNAGSWRFDTYAGATAWATGTLAAGTPGGITYAGGVSPYNGRIPMKTGTDGFFAQAQYSGLFDKRLTLTAGFRYNKQTFSDNPHPNPNFKGLDQGYGASTTDPRLAFSFDLDGKGRTVIRGGYGVFTSPTPLLLHSNTMTGNGQIITNYSFALNKTNAANLALFNSGLLSATNLLSGTSLRKATDAELAAIATSGLFTAGASPTSLWDPNNKLSQSKKLNLGVEHDLGNNLVVGISGTYVKYEHLQRFENINLGQLDSTGTLIAGGHYNDGYASSNNAWTTATRPGYAVVAGRRVDFGPAATVPGNPVGGFSDVYLVKTDGYGFYRGVSLTAKKTWNDRTGLIANATWSRSQDTGSFERGTYTSASTDFTSELGASQTPNPQDPASNFGYGDSDRRLVANVVFYFPLGQNLDVAIRGLYQSGLPYTAYYSNDLNGDNMANHILAGQSRNDQRQPSYQQFDVRVTRAFKLTKRFQVEAILDIYNILNKPDFFVPAANYKWGTNVATAPSASYGQLSQVDRTKSREVQLGIRLKY
ncbi:MAG: carboxypeptidase regulatory-like domain-containing protein [Holophagaceae bacterium]|uniref:Carboxypeptidase regulatory-like domain-containing protein n=1 Tax=Candidatus Geothrix odensensis TaxID=2954440 RepID=A0A936F010_9BACT|nr:carboxypeptidase regulatory-like domain-containing protein [Candidatus Geothrix odensensis]